MSAVAGALLLFGAAISWSKGGFEAAGPKPLPSFAAGGSIVTSEWLLQPVRAWITETDPMGSQAGSGNAFLMVELWLENRTRESSSLFVEALRLVSLGDGAERPWREAEDPRTLILLRDPSRGIAIHPGLPAHVAAVWTVPADPVDRVRLVALDRKFVERSALIGEAFWGRAKPVGVVDLTVEDRRDQPSTSAGQP